MRYVVLHSLYFLFIGMFLTFFSAAHAKTVSIRLPVNSNFSLDLAETKSAHLKHFLVNETARLIFNNFSNRLWFFWDTEDEYSFHMLELARFENFNDCEYSRENFYKASKKSGLIHSFCSQEHEHVSLIGIDVFFKGYSSLRAQEGHFDFYSFEDCHSFTKNLEVNDSTCTVAAACTQKNNKYIPIYFEKFFCCFGVK